MLSIILVLYYNIVSKSVLGRYIIDFAYLRECSKPFPPFAQTKRAVIAYNELYVKNNKQLLSGNLTFTKYPCEKCKWQAELAREEDGELKVLVSFKNMDCKNLLIDTIMSTIKVKVDRKTCRYLPASYVNTDFSPEKFEKSVHLPFLKNGMYYYTLRYNESCCTHACWEVKGEIKGVMRASKRH